LKRITLGQLSIIVFILAAFGLGVMLARLTSTPATVNQVPSTNTPRPAALIASLAASPTLAIPPTLTPSLTLRPPPTLEPPTITVVPSLTPSSTPIPTLNLNVTIPGLYGLQTPTATGSGCVPRKDWKLTYTIKRNDALINIATLYNTSVDELVKGNCLSNANVIIIGQVIKVPGTTQPVVPSVECISYEVLTPIDQTMSVGGSGSITFDWRGPRAPHNLIRVFRPDNTKYEDVVDWRQNDSVDMPPNLAAAGTYTWYVYPLDSNYVQVCPEGGPWHFTKALSPTLTPTPNPDPTRIGP